MLCMERMQTQRYKLRWQKRHTFQQTYHINRNLQLRGYTSINEFYEFLGLDGIEHGDEIAWDMSELMEGGIMWLDFENHRTKLEDGLECCIISAVWEPNKFDGELDIS